MWTVDQNRIINTLEVLSPEASLFIIASTRFTTQQAMVNAETAQARALMRGKDWTAARAGHTAAGIADVYP